MNRDDLLELCDRYVRRRGLGTMHVVETTMPPVLQIVDSYLHAEISESEKNSLLAYVRGPDHDDEDERFVDHAVLGEANLVELDDPVD
jgi:hypothetical protein